MPELKKRYRCRGRYGCPCRCRNLVRGCRDSILLTRYPATWMPTFGDRWRYAGLKRAFRFAVDNFSGLSQLRKRSYARARFHGNIQGCVGSLIGSGHGVVDRRWILCQRFSTRVLAALESIGPFTNTNKHRSHTAVCQEFAIMGDRLPWSDLSRSRSVTSRRFLNGESVL